MSASQAPVNASVPNTPAQPQAPSSGGNERTVVPGSEIGSQNSSHRQPAKTPVTAVATNTGVVTPQPQSKDERHAAQMISKLSEEKLFFAKVAVEANADAIYGIAEKDPKLAEKLLEEYDFGANTLEELKLKREKPTAKPEEIQQEIQKEQRLSKIEEELREERIKRLKMEHPDLQDEVEEEFRKIYSDPAFDRLDEVKKVEFARVLAGKQTTQKPTANDVALDMLKAAEGASSPFRSGTIVENRPTLTAEQERRYKSAGVNSKDLETYLPEDIDDIINSSLRLAR